MTRKPFTLVPDDKQRRALYEGVRMSAARITKLCQDRASGEQIWAETRIMQRILQQLQKLEIVDQIDKEADDAQQAEDTG